jgi:hypothetical protein
VIDVLSLNGTKELLLKATPAERGLFLLLGYASNQVNVLWKLLDVVTNETPENPIEQRISGAQTQIIVRLVVGVLWEALRLVQSRLVASETGKEFVPRLSPAATAALGRLKKWFGKSNSMAALRNDFCFHYPDPDDMEAAFQRAAASGAMEEADWGVYLTRTLLNSFYFVSDYVFAHGIANAVGDANVDDAHKQVLTSLAPIANDLSEVAHGFTAAMFVKYLGPDLTMTIVAKVEGAPNIENLRLPFYVEFPPLHFQGARNAESSASGRRGD